MVLHKRHNGFILSAYMNTYKGRLSFSGASFTKYLEVHLEESLNNQFRGGSLKCM